MAPGSRGRVYDWQPQQLLWHARHSDGINATRRNYGSDKITEPGLVTLRPNALALGSGSGPRQATGDARCDTSKGADEQSSRRAPGSLVDPGVCFVPGAGCNERYALSAYWPGHGITMQRRL